MNKDIIYQKIRARGGRITKIRKEIIEILFGSDCLMLQTEILACLKKRKINPNRSTIFRELQFLTKNNIIIKNNIAGIDYYEIPQDHHHHLVCVKCNKISKIKIGNRLGKQEKQITKKNKFKVVSHTLEFYGYCRDCR